jgi:hypothetical protein
VWSARVKRDGTVGASGAPWLPASPRTYVPSLACSGQGFCLLTYLKQLSTVPGMDLGTDNTVQLFDASGALVGAPARLWAGDTSGTGVAWDGRAFLTAWGNDSNITSDLEARSIGPGPTLEGAATPTLIQTGAIVAMQVPSVASDGKGHSLVAFMEDATRRAAGHLVTGDIPDAGDWLDASAPPPPLDAAPGDAAQAGDGAVSADATPAGGPSDAGGEGAAPLNDGSPAGAGEDAAPGSGDGAAVGSSPSTSSGCGCRVEGAGRGARGGALAFAFLLAATGARRFHRRRA